VTGVAQYVQWLATVLMIPIVLFVCEGIFLSIVHRITYTVGARATSLEAKRPGCENTCFYLVTRLRTKKLEVGFSANMKAAVIAGQIPQSLQAQVTLASPKLISQVRREVEVL